VGTILQIFGDRETEPHRMGTLRIESGMQGGEPAGRVAHNEALQRFEVDLGGGQTALLAYRRQNQTLNLFHTEVPPAWERQGIAAQLTKTALEYASSHGLTVVPTCPYVQAYLPDHPEYRPLIDASFSARRTRPGS
jgi:predicted GNAT family acetyltransferase